MTVPLYPNDARLFGPYRPLFWAKNVNANVLTDQPMIRMGSFQKYALVTGWCYTPSIDMTGAVMSIWTGAGGTGTQLVAGANLNALTIAADRLQLPAHSPSIRLVLPNEPTAFVRFNTARGAAATIEDVLLVGMALD